MERLDKVLAGTGRWSRREVKDLVRQGRVRIDGVTARTAEEKLDPAHTQVVVVSNGFHLTRARMLARRCGFEEVSTLAAPESHLPSRLKMYLREPLALVKAFVADR